MLEQHLTELVSDGFIARLENRRNRLDVSYGLTAFGRSLLPTMEALRAWGEEQGAITRAMARLRAAD